jgi:putative ABC transport system permease protein
VQVKKGFDPDKVAGDIKKYLRKSRGQKEGEEDFTVQTSEQLAESFSTVFTIVQVVLIGLASISLLVGGIGIMNTMFTSVLERTREIGVMKAIGARNSDIMKIFLIEAGLLCTIGGGIGIILGIGISKLIQYVAAQAGMGIIQAYFPWYLIVGALAFSFLVGTLSGIFPARRAAKLKPVDALRYE